MKAAQQAIRIDVDATNPGQFFACCGLLELADRLWPGADGWFQGPAFCITCQGTLQELLAAVAAAELKLVDAADIYSSAACLSFAGRNMLIDWWLDHGYHEKDPLRGSRLKPWAGTMQSVGIARALKAVLARPEAQTQRLFDFDCVVPDADNLKNKKEPYHFDSRRGANSLPLDIGFVQDPLGVETAAHPAVEFFCLIGLQRSRPAPTDRPRVFIYHTWAMPCEVILLPVAVNGLLGDPAAIPYRFENAFRTGQKKHKAFNPAIPVPIGDLT
jgi:hypothetical protein